MQRYILQRTGTMVKNFKQHHLQEHITPFALPSITEALKAGQ
jgi:hypothetical protein